MLASLRTRLRNMTMPDYSSEMRLEVDAAIERLWREHRKVEELEEIVRRARREMYANYRQVESINADPYLGDDDGIATGLYWETAIRN